MKVLKKIILISSLLLLSVLLTSCLSEKEQKTETNKQKFSTQTKADKTPTTLPVQYQTASYFVDKESSDDLTSAEESSLRVGARITSTRGPQPLWDIIKRLAALKGMNVSWASDVDKNILVDVDINADDDFYTALDNMLRQVEYFHEVEGSTIIIKHKETKRFQIGMPFVKQNYTTGVGGNVLGNEDTSSNIDGTIKLRSEDNEFDIWDNIKLNLDTLLEIWTFRREGENIEEEASSVGGSAADSSRTYSGSEKGVSSTEGEEEQASDTTDKAIQITGGKGYYLIDKPTGLITVTAPRPTMRKVEDYIKSLKKSLYKQISIEAKIIEVVLTDNSSIGINWSSVLKNFNISGDLTFGSNGQVYPFIFSNDDVVGDKTYSADNSSYFKTINPGQFISSVSLFTEGFDVFLNALNEQGDTKVLSNPKISVMNGQPSLITVGRNVTYIDSIESSIDSETGIITYTVETERILSGIGMALTATLLGDKDIILNLVPITSELTEPIVYEDVGNLGAKVGLPIIAVREMSTTVRVRDGEMLVIGGLISDSDETTGEFAPLLGDIPLLRYLFGYEEKKHLKRELIILLRPHII